MTRSRHAVLVVALALPGCAVGPNYARPTMESPDRFRGEELARSASVADLPWWYTFEDPALHELLDSALERSWDLQEAIARVDEARALARGEAWSLAPTIGVQAGTSGLHRTGGGPANVALGGVTNVGLGASWEIDVWGRIRRSAEAAGARADATVETRRGVVVALLADVAEAYFELRAIDAQLDIVERRIETRERSRETFVARLEGGIGTATEVANAEQLVADARVQQTELLAQREIRENQISVLVARPPGDVRRGATIESQEIAEVPPGLPSQLLERRPDVRRAEAELHAATADIGVAMADFFPRFDLTGFFGLNSTSLSTLVGGGLAAQYGATTSWLAPFLGGERIRAQYEAAQARERQAFARYHQTTLIAFREVADALVTRTQAGARIDAYEAQRSATERRLELARARFDGGVASYLEVTLAEDDILPVELGLVSARRDRLVATVRLYRALGGGWTR